MSDTTNCYCQRFYSVTGFSYDDEGEPYASCEGDFYDVNIARIFAKRILGYPCFRVRVESCVSKPERLERRTIHDFRCVDKHYYDAGAPSLPDCEDSPMFATCCTEWVEV